MDDTPRPDEETHKLFDHLPDPGSLLDEGPENTVNTHTTYSYITRVKYHNDLVGIFGDNLA